MKRIFVASPYSGDVDVNVQFAQCACKYVINQGHNPFAPHLFYPQFMQEETQREEGIRRGIQVLNDCNEVWVFYDQGISQGMQEELKVAYAVNKPVRYLRLQDVDKPGYLHAVLRGFKRWPFATS